MKIKNTAIKEVKLIEHNSLINNIEVKNDCKIIWQYDILKRFIDPDIKLFMCEYEKKIRKSNTLKGLYYNNNFRNSSLLIRCLKGRIYQVAVDIRNNSNTYKKWVGYELSSENDLQMYIPKGFAYGLLSLEDDSIVQYISESYLDEDGNKIINWNDYKIEIKWPDIPKYINCRDKYAEGIEQIERNHGKNENE